MRKFVFIFYYTMLRRGRKTAGAQRPEAAHGIHFVNFAQDRRGVGGMPPQQVSRKPVPRWAGLAA
jgi:hypothetical protein